MRRFITRMDLYRVNEFSFNLTISCQIQFIYMAFYFLLENQKKNFILTQTRYTHTHAYDGERVLWRLVISFFYSKSRKKFSSESIFVVEKLITFSGEEWRETHVEAI